MNNKTRDFFGEQPPQEFEVDPRVLRRRTRREVLLFGAAAMATVAGTGSLLPQETLSRLGLHRNMDSPTKQWLLDASGNRDPYSMSLDLATARHPQTLLATHLNRQSLTVEHGAPLRLLVPVKLGLKNVKAITSLTYVEHEPRDYWAERGYSRYDGI